MQNIKKIGKSLIFSSILLIITFSASIYGFNRLLNKADSVEHTNLVLLSLNNILSSLKDAETGQRGYLLTEDIEFLEPYIGSYYKVIQDFKVLKSLLVDNKNQMKRLDTLKVLINKRYSFLNKTIELEKAEKTDEARQIVLKKEGKKIMDQIRTLVSIMSNEEISLKEERFAQVKSSTIFTSAFLVISSFLSLLTVSLAFWKLQKKLEQESILKQELNIINIELAEKNEEYLRTQENLKTLNNSLEAKVEERTLHLSEAREELQNVNTELQQQNIKLKRINQDLDNFIYTASHDLKAPISNIEGLINLVKKYECYENEESRKVIDMIGISGVKLKLVIEDLALVVKVQNELDYNVEKISIEEAIEDIKISIKDLISAASAEIELNTEGNDFIIFSRNNFRSILYNLIINAIKYRSPERTPLIEIETAKEEHYSVLTIKDNGLGIEETKIDKIFSMFKRLHSNVEGTGIGLFIVKRIIDNAGGKIEVKSVLNKGTTFKIYFPLPSSSL